MRVLVSISSTTKNPGYYLGKGRCDPNWRRTVYIIPAVPSIITSQPTDRLTNHFGVYRFKRRARLKRTIHISFYTVRYCIALNSLATTLPGFVPLLLLSLLFRLQSKRSTTSSRLTKSLRERERERGRVFKKMALPLSLTLCSFLLLIAPPVILSRVSLEPQKKFQSGSSNTLISSKLSTLDVLVLICSRYL